MVRNKSDAVRRDYNGCFRSSTIRRVYECFIVSACLIYGATGIVKLITAAGDARYLYTRDVLLSWLSVRDLLLVSGVLEVSIAFIVVQSKNHYSNLALLAWLSMLIAVYRIGTSWLGQAGPCKCLGNIPEILHISNTFMDMVMKGILGYVLILSTGMIIVLKVGRARRATMGNVLEVRGQKQTGNS